MKSAPVTGYPRDTFHHNLLFSTAIHHNLQYVCNMSEICPQYVRNMSAIRLQYLQYPQPLPSPQNSTNFHCKDNSTPPPESICAQYRACPVPVPCLLCACSPSNQVNDINLSFLSLTFFPHATSWLHYTVHVHNLIISTSLYTIIACIHFVTLHCVKLHLVLFYPILLCLACKITQKPPCLWLNNMLCLLKK